MTNDRPRTGEALGYTANKGRAIRCAAEGCDRGDLYRYAGRPWCGHHRLTIMEDIARMAIARTHAGLPLTLEAAECLAAFPAPRSSFAPIAA